MKIADVSFNNTYWALLYGSINHTMCFNYSIFPGLIAKRKTNLNLPMM